MISSVSMTNYSYPTPQASGSGAVPKTAEAAPAQMNSLSSTSITSGLTDNGLAFLALLALFSDDDDQNLSAAQKAALAVLVLGAMQNLETGRSKSGGGSDTYNTLIAAAPIVSTAPLFYTAGGTVGSTGAPTTGTLYSASV